MVGMYIVKKAPDLRLRAENIAQMGKDSVRRHWEPISHRLPVDRGLRLQVVSDLRYRITPSVSLLVAYGLVSPRKHHGLENDAVDFVHVLNYETNNVAKPVIVASINDAHLQRRSHARCSDILKSLMLHFHVISDTAMPVLRFGNAIKLQIDGVQSGRLCFERKISVLRKSNSIRRDVNPMESHALRVANGVKQDRRKRSLTT